METLEKHKDIVAAYPRITFLTDDLRLNKQLKEAREYKNHLDKTIKMKNALRLSDLKKYQSSFNI